MGARQAFSSNADFSGMDGTHDLFISRVVHQAWVDVSESGTEAAAATAVVVTTRAALTQEPVHIDHPFLFFIRDNPSGTILFAGRVTDPGSQP